MFKTPACAKDDRIVQFSEILHITIATARYGLRLGSTKRVSIELARGIDEDNCKTTSYGDVNIANLSLVASSCQTDDAALAKLRYDALLLHTLRASSTRFALGIPRNTV